MWCNNNNLFLINCVKIYIIIYRIGDVKTISFTVSNYGGVNRTKNGAAVEHKANKVHKEYLEKARKADIKWNNTPQNAIGPIESHLNEFGTVIPFVFGYLGEANKAVRTLLKEIATVGARNLWRQMGQTCQVNAYGVLLNSYRRTVKPLPQATRVWEAKV